MKVAGQATQEHNASAEQSHYLKLLPHETTTNHEGCDGRTLKLAGAGSLSLEGFSILAGTCLFSFVRFRKAALHEYFVTDALCHVLLHDPCASREDVYSHFSFLSTQTNRHTQLFVCILLVEMFIGCVPFSFHEGFIAQGKLCISRIRGHLSTCRYTGHEGADVEQTSRTCYRKMF